MTSENPALEEYIEKIPNEIRRAIRGLAGERQFGIIVLLIERNGGSYTEIKNELDLHQETLSRSLSEMQKGGLIVRHELDSGQGYQTRYEATEFGKRVLDGLFDAIQPKASRQQLQPVYDTVVEKGDADSVYKVNETTTKRSTTEINLGEIDDELNDDWNTSIENSPA